MNEFGRNVFGGVFVRNIGFLSHSLICWKNTKELTARFGLLNWNKNHMADYFKRLNHEYYDQQEDYATAGNELDVILIKNCFVSFVRLETNTSFKFSLFDVYRYLFFVYDSLVFLSRQFPFKATV